MSNRMSEKHHSSKMIMDSIHGAIRLYEHEVYVIDHPLFQRLRHVIQNDVLHLTFMGSTHTRFSHSIGALHVASSMFKQIIMNKVIFQEAICDQFQLSSKQNNAIAYLEKCLRLAVLLHDTGHGAFSHQTEKSQVVRAILGEKGCFEKLWEGKDISSIYPVTPTELHHEHYSIRSAYEILHDIEIEQAGIFAMDVLGIMETTAGITSEKFNSASEEVWSLFTKATTTKSGDAIDKPRNVLNVLRCILSGEFDADKADYLLRDSMHTGANLGKFDLDSLINSLGASWIPDDDALRMTINKKGIGALEDVIFCRFQMYSYVYNHKTTNGVELLLHLAVDEVLSDKSVEDEFRLFLTDIKQFAYLTDSFFWEKFRTIARKDDKSSSYALINRKKLANLGTFKDLDDHQIESMRQSISLETGIDPKEIYSSTHTARFSKINGDFRDIMIEVINPISKSKSYSQICEVSDFFAKFTDLKSTSFHAKREKLG